jgi:hypothetical protein
MAFVVCVSVMRPTPAPAMEIEKFDRMAAQEQSDYIVVLIEGAQQVLVKDSKKDLADKVRVLFTNILPGDQSPVGVVEFESNLARARAADLRNLEKDPRAQRLEVEDAMAVTLKKNGIELPVSFYAIASGFRPKLPSKN